MVRRRRRQVRRRRVEPAGGPPLRRPGQDHLGGPLRERAARRLGPPRAHRGPGRGRRRRQRALPLRGSQRLQAARGRPRHGHLLRLQQLAGRLLQALPGPAQGHSPAQRGRRGRRRFGDASHSRAGPGGSDCKYASQRADVRPPGLRAPVGSSAGAVDAPLPSRRHGALAAGAPDNSHGPARGADHTGGLPAQRDSSDDLLRRLRALSGPAGGHRGVST